jgi:putative molybdopterin biosynthesis protein
VNNENEEEQSSRPPEQETYLTVKQVAEYVHLNEKKIYALIRDGVIPATKATGKWLFPRRLIDEWLLESAHGGVLADRLIVTGSDDPLLAAGLTTLAQQLAGAALVTYLPTASRPGLELLSRRLANAAAIHWGPADAAQQQHRALVEQFPGHGDWVLVRLFRRQQGILLRRGYAGGMALEDLVQSQVRWIARQAGAGSQHALETQLCDHGIDPSLPNVCAAALTEREAASLLVRQHADCAPGVRAAAVEFGLDFIPLHWECFDLVVPRPIFFRQLVQDLLEVFRAPRMQQLAIDLVGYELEPLGQLIPL